MGDGEDQYSDSDGSDGSSFEHLDMCPLESQCNPALDGVFDKDAVLERVAKLTPPELAALSELCMCPKGCKYRKCVDSDPAWWPHCAAAWYEPGAAPEKPGKPPKQRKTWKNAYLALRPEEGPTPEEVAAREAKIKAREEKLAQWDLENKAGRLSVKGTGRGGETVVSPLAGKEDKGAMREFYKTVRSKPKGKTRKGGDAMLAEVLPRAGAALASANAVDSVSDQDLASEKWLIVQTPTSDASATSRLRARGAAVVAHEAVLSGIVRHKL